MTITNVSFLGQTTAQNNRLKDLGTELSELERQITTGKQYDTLAGFGGVTAQSVQLTRIDSSSIQTYLSNITVVNNRIQQMNQAMQSAQGVAQQVVDSITSALQTSSADVPSIVALAKNALSFVEDLANLNIDGRYLFAGSDTTSQPFSDSATLNANMQTEMTNWLNGTNTTAQFQSNVDAFSTAQLGLNPALTSAGGVTARIDTSTNIDYTVKADQDGFQQIIAALGLMANMQVPNSGTDVPTTTDLDQMLTHVSQMAKGGIDQLTSAQTRLATQSTLVASIQNDHNQDATTLANLTQTMEGTDTTTAIAKLQSLQTQLEASYNVTSSMTKLSLVNFL